MKKHAFLIFAHKQPNLMGRTIRRLEAENHYFFIHVDKKTKNYSDFKLAVKDIPNVFFHEDRFAVYHAGSSHLLATLALMRDVIRLVPDYDYIHIISAQDYPLRSNEQFDAFFENTSHSFMYLDEEELHNKNINYLKRGVNEFHFNRTSTTLAKIYEKLRLGSIIALFYKRAPIKNLHGGWDWYSWNKKVLDAFMQYINQNPQYLKRFNHTVCPTEKIVQTFVCDKTEQLEIETTNPLRYISWHAHRPVDTDYRPFTLTEQDYDFIIDSKAFFCRKVDEIESAKLLDMIDEQRGSEYDINEHSNYV